MLTTNFYVMQAVEATQRSIYKKATTPEGVAVDVVATGGNTYYPRILPTSGGVVFSYNSLGVVVGSGNAPATKADYKLENIITSGLKSVSSTNATDALDNGVENIKAIILQNTTETDITISEVGLIGMCYSGSGDSYYKYLMVDRTVLDVPVTIPAGESKAISYSIRINWPD